MHQPNLLGFDGDEEPAAAPPCGAADDSCGAADDSCGAADDSCGAADEQPLVTGQAAISDQSPLMVTTVGSDTGEDGDTTRTVMQLHTSGEDAGQDEAQVNEQLAVSGADADSSKPLAGATVVLVDAHSLIYQVFHALPPMTSPSGLPVAAVHGFVSDLIELIQRKSPTYLICAFDKGAVTFRNDLFADYKAQRESMPEELRQQIPLIRQVVEAMGIGIMQCVGFEADDILATVSKQVDAAGGECLIVTSDKDCRQLITDRVRLYNIRKNQEMTAAELMADWGIRPDQVVDYQALVGDPVDNVPGIPLIGPKIACQLLTQFDTLDAILDNADSVAGAKRKENLKTGREKAMLSRQLVKLRDDVPCEPPWEQSTMQADVTKLTELMDLFGFRRLRRASAKFLAASKQSSPKPRWHPRSTTN